MDEYYWDYVNEKTKMGLYITKTEKKLIDESLEEEKILLDVGGGSGRFAVPLYEKGYNIVCLEKDFIPLKKLNRKNSGIKSVRADAADMPFKDNTFDCIIAVQIIDYLPEEQFLKEITRILKNKRRLILTISNKNSLRNFLRKSNHKNFYKYSFEEMKEILKGLGFDIKKARGYCWVPFKRASNNKLIPVFSFMEKTFQLKFFYSVSPWVFIEAIVEK